MVPLRNLPSFGNSSAVAVAPPTSRVLTSCEDPSTLLVEAPESVKLQGSVETGFDGRFAHFLFVARASTLTMDLQELLDSTLAGLGYELVDFDRSGRGLMRIFIDKPGGIDVEDCARVSNHLSRVFAVENVAYERMEISSPGLDRPLRKERDFARFAGQKVRIKVRVPVEGQRNFIGVLRESGAGKVEIEADGRRVSLDLTNLDKARLVPTF